jgi:hypothetical protein
MADDDEPKGEDPGAADKPPRMVVMTLEDLVKAGYINPHSVPTLEVPPGMPAQVVRLTRTSMEILLQSDRGAAMIGGAYLEANLEAALKSALSDKGIKNKKGEIATQLFSLLFDDYSHGPLGTFSRKIRMAYALDLIGEHTYEDLVIIKDIRNEFAHNFEVKNRPSEGISFETQSIKDRCNQLRIAKDDPYAAYKEYREMMKLDAPRGKFIYAVLDICRLIETDTMHRDLIKQATPAPDDLDSPELP